MIKKSFFPNHLLEKNNKAHCQSIRSGSGAIKGWWTGPAKIQLYKAQQGGSMVTRPLSGH